MWRYDANGDKFCIKYQLWEIFSFYCQLSLCMFKWRKKIATLRFASLNNENLKLFLSSAAQ